MGHTSAKIILFCSLFSLATLVLSTPTDDQKRAALRDKIELVCNSRSKIVRNAVVCDCKKGRACKKPGLLRRLVQRLRLPRSKVRQVWKFDPRKILTRCGRNGFVLFANVVPTGKASFAFHTCFIREQPPRK